MLFRSYLDKIVSKQQAEKWFNSLGHTTEHETFAALSGISDGSAADCINAFVGGRSITGGATMENLTTWIDSTVAGTQDIADKFTVFAASDISGYNILYANDATNLFCDDADVQLYKTF